MMEYYETGYRAAKGRPLLTFNATHEIIIEGLHNQCIQFIDKGSDDSGMHSCDNFLF